VLSWQTKYNVLTTVFHRLVRRVTDSSNFCFHLARIMFELCLKGYALNRMLRMLINLIAMHAYGRYFGSSRMFMRHIARFMLPMVRATPMVPLSFTTLLQQL
jgi:hypothetical protein